MLIAYYLLLIASECTHTFLIPTAALKELVDFLCQFHGCLGPYRSTGGRK